MTHTITIHRYVPTDIRLGRHVRHDSRSLDFKIFPEEVPAPKKINTFWDSGTGPLNQGKTSSCTGNATTQWLNSHYADKNRAKIRAGGGFFTEADALKIYSLGTHLDGFPGVYPPDDTGCDGLSVAKAAKKLGLLKSYSHAIGADAIKVVAERQPFIQGTVWTKTMFKPTNGLVKVGSHAQSNEAGGHEYEGAGIDWTEEVVIYRNSWGDQDAWPGCRPGGYFAIGFGKNHNYDFEYLIEAQGDVTVLHGIA